MSSALNEIIEALDGFAHARLASSDRRAHVRLKPRDLHRPMRARLKHGPILTVIDVSAGGALIETPARLTPGGRLVLEFITPDAQRITAVPSRVLRAEVASLANGVHYRGGCSFSSLLPLGRLRGSAGLNGGRAPGPVQTERLQHLRRIQEDSGIASDPVLARLMEEIVVMAQDGRSPAALMTLVEQRLRQHVPLLAMTVGDPAGSSPIGHSLAFDVPAAEAGDPRAAQVVFRPAGRLDDSQVRRLENGAAVMGLLHNWYRRMASVFF